MATTTATDKIITASHLLKKKIEEKHKASFCEEHILHKLSNPSPMYESNSVAICHALFRTGKTALPPDHDWRKKFN
jgi:hypothetical protein